MYTTPLLFPQRRLARQVRQQFVVVGICGGLADLDKTVQDFLTALMNQTGTAGKCSRRDAWLRTSKTCRVDQSALARPGKRLWLPM